MAYETKPNTGSLFKNDKKESDTHADYKGQALIGGVEHWLDAWINESSGGVKYMSLKFKPKDAPRTTSVASSQDYRAPLDDESEIPF